jgi:xylulose-5-phosphate/fructose-6-phosphate phosphoketolase
MARRLTPLATAWHSNKFLDPVTDGAVLPILHLNVQDFQPTLLARITREELDFSVPRLRVDALLRRGYEPELMHKGYGATAPTPQWSRSKHSSRTPAFTATSHVHAGR